MKAVRFWGAGDVRLEEINEPDINEDEVLIKIAYAGICGSDLHIVRKGMFIDNPPQVMGHEFAGIVIKTGKEVKALKVGVQVTGDPRVFCTNCEWCAAGKGNLCSELGFIGEVQPGSFAEYMVLKADKVIPLPKGVDLIFGSMAEPVAVGLALAEKAAFDKDKSIGIIGAGPIGLIIALLAKEIYKVEEVFVVDIAEARLDLARKIGLNAAFREKPSSCQVDTVVEAAGSGVALKEAFDWVKAEGFVVIAGIYEDNVEFNPNPIVAKEIKVTGLHGYQKYHIECALQLMAEGKLKKLAELVTVMPLNKALEAFDLLLAKEKMLAKILLSPN